MVLSDRTIREFVATGRIRMAPYEEANVQPSSIDVRLGRQVRTFKHSHRHGYVDVKQPTEDLTELVEIEGDTPFILHPGEFVRGSTAELVGLPDDLVDGMDRLVRHSGGSRSDLVRRAIAAYLYREACERDAQVYERNPLTDAELALADDSDSWSVTPAWWATSCQVVYERPTSSVRLSRSRCCLADRWPALRVDGAVRGAE